MALPSVSAQDGPAQCMDNALCKTGTVRGTTRRPHFSHISISVTKFGYRYFWLYLSNLHELSLEIWQLLPGTSCM